MDVSDVDTATAESKAANATTMSSPTSTSSDASRNQDQSESQFVFQEQAPATSDSTPPSLQQTSTAKSPPIPEATSATYSGYGLQARAIRKFEKCRFFFKNNSSKVLSQAKVRLPTVRRVGLRDDFWLTSSAFHLNVQPSVAIWLVIKGVRCEPLAESPNLKSTG
uniref:Retrotransposon protein, putative, Ty3-gypsy subclass n=1 Tax=Oryza sativa subsp. japonica TaxID=39947 RepID=Q7XDU4_ORYSJ|nr:retrotransposon protein, putative, Ty3-gypsy subclass [Oryza sativa Japonica Group]